MSEDPAERLTAANDEQLDNSEVSFDGSAGNPSLSSVQFFRGPDASTDPSKQAEITPLYLSDTTPNPDGLAEFLHGSELLGLNTEKKPLQPQQYTLAAALNALGPDGLSLHLQTAVCFPRRSSKTTTLWSLILGRCESREDYQVGYTAITGQAARDRFIKDVLTVLERRQPDPDTRGWKANRAAGSTHIQWDNGSRLSILSPSGEAFRGDSYDLIVIDEGQVHDADVSADLLAGTLPTFDTRPGAQLVVAGTARDRTGILWSTLELGRKGEAGIVEYAAPDDTRIHVEDQPREGTTADPAVWLAAHPGLSGLTTLKSIEANWQALKPDDFAAEYLGIWRSTSRHSFLDPAKWAQTGLDGPTPQPPKTFALAISVHPEQTSAAICAAWRDGDGLAHIVLLGHRRGVNWVSTEASRLALKYRVPIVYDSQSGASSLIAEQFLRVSPRPLLQKQIWSNVSNAAELLVKELNSGTLRHYRDQAAMEAAAPLVTKRTTASSKRWALGRVTREADITPLESAAMALRFFDETPVRKPLPRMTAA
jgi:hypothetical protein